MKTGHIQGQESTPGYDAQKLCYSTHQEQRECWGAGVLYLVGELHVISLYDLRGIML